MIPRRVLLVCAICLIGCRASAPPLATPAQVIASKTDLWGEAASKYLVGAIDMLKTLNPNAKRLALINEKDPFSTDVATVVARLRP